MTNSKLITLVLLVDVCFSSIQPTTKITTPFIHQHVVNHSHIGTYSVSRVLSTISLHQAHISSSQTNT